MEHIGRQLNKEPTDIKYTNLLRKGNTDSVNHVEACDRVHDTWQIVRIVYTFIEVLMIIKLMPDRWAFFAGKMSFQPLKVQFMNNSNLKRRLSMLQTNIKNVALQ